MEEQASRLSLDGVANVSNSVLGFLDAFLSNSAAVATIIAACLGALMAGISLRFVYVQISITRRQNEQERRWKKSEFVRSLLSQMLDDSHIVLIARILDWREGPARIPEYFQPLFQEIRGSEVGEPWDHPRVGDAFFEINWPRFVDSLQVLRPEREAHAEWRKADKFMYRTCFDSFCAFIQSVAEDVRGLGVQASEYADLSFYCHRVIFPLNAERVPDNHAHTVLRSFIESYYNDRTYNVILVQAEVYALQHEGVPKPSSIFPGRCHYPTLETLYPKIYAPVSGSRWARLLGAFGLTRAQTRLNSERKAGDERHTY